MSSTQAIEIRATLRDAIESTDSIHRDDLVAEVADRVDCAEAAVAEELDNCEKHGFVYVVQGEVKLT